MDRRVAGQLVTPESDLRLAFIGWGAIARTVAGMIADDSVEIVAVAERDATIHRPDLPTGALLITEPHELAATGAELVVEAASRESVAPWGRAALETGADFIVSSVSAFAEPDVLSSLTEMARRNRSQLHIQPGALGGVDALAAARTLGIDHVEHRIIKPPRAWLDTPAENLCQLDELSEAVEFFTGTPAQAASEFPKNANVAMTTALAGIGTTATRITLVADPDATTNRHEINASGAFGELTVALSNKALPDNPKTSALAALNLVRAIRNRVSPLVI